MEISDRDAKRIFVADFNLQAAKMKPLSGDELRALAETVSGGGQPAPGSPAGAPGGAGAGLPGGGVPPGAPAVPGSPQGNQGAISGLDGGLLPQPPPPETTGGLSRLPSGKGKITADYDEQGRVTKITQTLIPGVGGLQKSGG